MDFLDRRTLDEIHYYVDPFMSSVGMPITILGIRLWANKERYYGDEFTKNLMRFLPDDPITHTTWTWQVRWLPRGKDSIAFYGDFELYKNDVIALKLAVS
jgi:hypothetical protein